MLLVLQHLLALLILQRYSSGALTIADINSSGGGVLSLKGNGGGTTLAKFTNGGSAELNWNNTKRLETTTSGVTVTGTVAAPDYIILVMVHNLLVYLGVNTSQFNVNKFRCIWYLNI